MKLLRRLPALASFSLLWAIPLSLPAEEQRASVATTKANMSASLEARKILGIQISSNIWGKGIQKEFSDLFDLLELSRGEVNRSTSVTLERVVQICKVSRRAERAYISYQLTLGKESFDREVQQIATCLMKEALEHVKGMGKLPDFSNEIQAPDYTQSLRSITKRHHNAKYGIIKLLGGTNWECGKVEL